MSKNTIDHALAEKVLLQIEMHPEELLTEGKINTTGIEQRAKDKLGLETDGLFYVSDLRAKRVLEHMVDPTSTPKSVTNLIYTDYL